MSLHAEPSLEAIQRLHTQRRNSTISSIVVAGLMLTLVVVILGILLLPSLDKTMPDPHPVPVVTVKPPPDDPPPSPRPARNPTPPAHSPTNVLVANTTSLTSIMMPDVDVTSPSMDFGAVEDLGDSDGFNPNDGFDQVPPVMSKRCSPEDRLARLRKPAALRPVRRPSSRRWIGSSPPRARTDHGGPPTSPR